MAEVTTLTIRGEDRTKQAFRSVNAGIDRMEKNMSALSAKTAVVTGGLSQMAGVMAGMVGIGALGAFSRSIITLGDRLQNVSIQTGIAVEELEILQYAASQTGVGTDQLNAAIQKFSINIGKAEDGTVAQLDAFEALGISLKNNEGNLIDTSQLFVEVADGISKVEDPANKARIASDLFGRTGVELLALLNGGAGQIQFFSDRLRDMGGIMGKTASDEFSNFNDRMDDLNRILRAKVAGALVVVLPAITALAENFDHLAKFVGIVATAFITAKLPVLIGSVTGAISALTVAISTNPLGLTCCRCYLRRCSSTSL